MPGCNITTGGLDQTEFTRPLPWIGLYIMVGTLACTLAMVIDTVSGLRNRHFWFPTKFFSLNSSTLTILAVATKFSVDLNTAMPRKLDQLAKLSSTALICTAIANFMPSLGDMHASGIISNVIAVGIIVITVIVNVAMQMGSGVIYVFLPEHALILSLMLLMLAILGASALMVTPFQQELEKIYDVERRMLDFEYDKISRKVPNRAESGSIIAELKKSVKKLWVLAYFYSPQNIFKITPSCHASGALCLVIPGVLLEASVRALIMDSVSFCRGTCDYQWSSILVLSSQAVAVGVGTIAPASRFFYNVSILRHMPINFTSLWSEEYWYKQLFAWSYAPLIFQPRSRRIRKIATNTRNFIISVFIKFQTGVVSIAQLLQFALLVSVRLLDCRRDGHMNIEEFIDRSGCKYIEGCIKWGRKKQPTHFLQFIREYSTVNEGFKGVHWFNSDMEPSTFSEEPRNCWALPVVTLATIVVSLPYIEQSLIDSLLDAVGEGLTYVRLVDKNLDTEGSRQRTRQAADQVWQGIDVNRRWFRTDLIRLVIEEKSAKEMITKLGDAGGRCAIEFREERESFKFREETEALAGDCMYRVSRTLLRDYDNDFGSEKPEKQLFEWLRMTIADIMGACFTNLPRAFCMERNWDGPIVEREKIIRQSTLLLEGADAILKIVGEPRADLYEGKPYYIESWRMKERAGRPSVQSVCSHSL